MIESLAALGGAIAAGVEGSALARWVGRAPLAYPLISAAHVLGIGLLLGPLLVADLRLMGRLSPVLDPALPALERVALAGFALAAATGALLAAVRLGHYAALPAFQAKLGLIALAGLNAGLLARARARGGAGARRAASAGAASLALWLGALLAGRWIAFAV